MERLYHLGFYQSLKLSTVSEAFKKRTYKFFEELFRIELASTRKRYQKKFSFPLRIIDSTEVVIKHTKFAWEKFKHSTNMFKIHMELCGMTQLPMSINITSGKIGDITLAKDKMYLLYGNCLTKLL